MNSCYEIEDTVFNKLPDYGYSIEASRAIFEWYHR